jgi:hypothetical protein
MPLNILTPHSIYEVMATQHVDRRVGFTVMMRPQDLAEIRLVADADQTSASAWARRAIVRALAREAVTADRRAAADKGD